MEGEATTREQPTNSGWQAPGMRVHRRRLSINVGYRALFSHINTPSPSISSGGEGMVDRNIINTCGLTKDFR